MSVAEHAQSPRFLPSLVTLHLDPARLRLEFVPKLGSAAVKQPVSVQQWWEEDLVFLDPAGIFTINRRDLVLAAAEKDGGAHVDSDLESRYAIIDQGADWSMTVNSPSGASIYVAATNGNLASLRQMG